MQEHLPPDDMPPAWMWPLDHELELHLNRLREKYRARDDGEEPPGGYADNELYDESWGKRSA